MRFHTEIFLLIFILLTTSIFSMTFGTVHTSKSYQTAAIERGFALYCPTNGKFAWKDECEDK